MTIILGFILAVLLWCGWQIFLTDLMTKDLNKVQSIQYKTYFAVLVYLTILSAYHILVILLAFLAGGSDAGA